MPTRVHRPGPGRALTAAVLSLVPQRRRRARVRWAAALLASAAAASATTALVLGEGRWPSVAAGAGSAATWAAAPAASALPTAAPADGTAAAAPAPALTGAPGADRAALQQQLDQLRLALGVAQARGAELERQIDTLAQRGRQCQEELVFFRQSGRRGAP